MDNMHGFLIGAGIAAAGYWIGRGIEIGLRCIAESVRLRKP